MDTFLVMAPGPFTTVQDRGRFGFQKMGVPVSGALDADAYHAANLLVGNPAGAAVLEATILGPHLAVMREADIALAGADMEAKLNFKPVPPWRSIRVGPGDFLSFQALKRGCRGYLAVTGGIEVPEVMGSRSTYVGGGLGGFSGRPLKKGDILRCGAGRLLDRPRAMPEEWIPENTGDIVLRAVPGPQEDFFSEGLEALFSSPFMVTAKADRMGYRLQGPPVVQAEGAPKSIISEPTVPGGIQIPADNQPIILLVEQTVGGYTKIATVISTDLPRLAQATPGDTVRFERVDLETAHTLYRERLQRRKEMASLLAAAT
jgi:biotin-dependent carboxylase-like uncharacterized protein